MRLEVNWKGYNQGRLLALQSKELEGDLFNFFPSKAVRLFE